jgi:copper chaperone
MQEKGETMTEKTLKVPDMSCGHCKAAVEGELNRLSGVESSSADVEKGTVVVRYDAGEVSTEQLKHAIEDAGYAVVA